MWTRVFQKTFSGKGFSYQILCFYESGLDQDSKFVQRGFPDQPPATKTKSPTSKVGNYHFMNISVHHSTSNQGLSATSQAPRELGDSQKIFQIRDASRISQNSSENCPNCGSANLSTGAGLKPGQISLRCSECKHFVGYQNLEKLQRLRRQKGLTLCLELLEKQGLTGNVAIFILSIVGGVS